MNDQRDAQPNVPQRKNDSGALLLDTGAEVLALSFNDLLGMPEQHQVPDVSRYVPQLSGGGVRLQALLTNVPIPEDITHLTFHSSDGSFSSSLELHAVLDSGILLYAREGAPLERTKGGPFRLVLPNRADVCSSVKNLGRIELTGAKGPAAA